MTTYQDRLRTNVRMSFNSIKTGRFTPVGPYVMTDPGKKTRLSALLFYTSYQDGLGTNIGKALKKRDDACFLQREGPTLLARAMMATGTACGCRIRWWYGSLAHEATCSTTRQGERKQKYTLTRPRYAMPSSSSEKRSFAKTGSRQTLL